MVRGEVSNSTFACPDTKQDQPDMRSRISASEKSSGRELGLDNACSNTSRTGPGSNQNYRHKQEASICRAPGRTLNHFKTLPRARPGNIITLLQMPDQKAPSGFRPSLAAPCCQAVGRGNWFQTTDNANRTQ